VLGVLVSFAASGLIHEVIVNGPLYMIYGRSWFGSMFLYFTIQGFVVLLERKHLRQRPRMRRLLAFLTILGPAPLVLNPGTVQIFHLL
jgi:hypothetical protein